MPAKCGGGNPSSVGSGGFRRCAIYTRKSSEEGLEQSFNSLDAQREACEAYIASQRHEGWRALPTTYDDGGISGGTMDRPALLRLLRDIRARKVDLVVVYKVDRLTRSLADFAKIVEVFDANGASFVSVTQQFNTASSMGRLTLNMLLSFAQFEREVTGERIRDKIAASKRKGMWMGGVPPLGYDIQDRNLVINEEEAQTVRYIFETYVALGAVRPLQEQLDAERITTKRHISAKGNTHGGRPISRGHLYHLLQNRLYRGEIVHKDQTYPGQHEPIIDQDLWDRVQAQLEQNRVEQRAQQTTIQTSLLAGLVTDQAGDKLVPTYASKNGKRYRYYISQASRPEPATTRPTPSVSRRRIWSGWSHNGSAAGSPAPPTCSMASAHTSLQRSIKPSSPQPTSSRPPGTSPQPTADATSSRPSSTASPSATPASRSPSGRSRLPNICLARTARASAPIPTPILITRSPSSSPSMRSSAGTAWQ